MRVTDAMTLRMLLAATGRLGERVAVLQEQITSGRRLLHPQDDPPGAAQTVRATSRISSLGSERETVEFGRSVLAAEDAALGDANDIMVRAEELATEAANGLVGDAGQAAAREEAHGLLDALVGVANSSFGGRRLFGGLATGTAPFVDPDDPSFDPSAPYVGPSTAFSVAIGDGEKVQLATPGDQLFGAAIKALADLEQALASGGDVSATLDDLATARETISAERGSVGARQERLGARSDQLSLLTTSAESLRSRARDVDIAASVAGLVQVQTALQAALATAARLLPGNLAQLLGI